MKPHPEGRRSRSRESEALAGHRVRSHTADMIVEAWAPTRVACLQEAVAGVVGAFAEARDDAKGDRVPVELDPGDDGEMLVALLEDVVYAVDALDAVPLAATLHERADGGVSGWLETVPATSVIEVGATPKGVSRSDLSFAEEEKGRWRCRVEIDV